MIRPGRAAGGSPARGSVPLTGTEREQLAALAFRGTL